MFPIIKLTLSSNLQTTIYPDKVMMMEENTIIHKTFYLTIIKSSTLMYLSRKQIMLAVFFPEHLNKIKTTQSFVIQFNLLISN